jgi:hypothetical protein
VVKILVPASDGKPEMLHVFEDEGEQADYYHFIDTDCPCAPLLGESNSGEYIVTHHSFEKAVRWNG